MNGEPGGPMEIRWKAASLVCSLLLSLLAGGTAWAQSQPKAKGIESEGYVWNKLVGEEAAALKLKGNVENGEEIFEVCSACHLPSGSGRPDGTFPQLVGQHSTVIIKQIADIRAGRRDNPIMYPFAKTLNDAQDLADVAAYIQTLPIPSNNGKGPEKNLERAAALYQKNCVRCHQDHGQGNAEKFYPVLAGQHYKYLLRQIRDIKAGRRRNANPDMVKVVSKIDDDDLKILVDYMSRLKWPERQPGH
ncbi:MAG: c-type cytochrome [Myxococcota bacterium]